MNLPKNTMFNVVQSVYYYLFLSALVSAFCIAIYWQTEREQAVFEISNKHVVLDSTKKDFTVDVNFCSPEKRELKISRYYENLETQVMYHVPEGTYQTAGSGCFKTQLNAYAGRLDPGNYKYHVTVAYDLNPLRKIEKKVATIQVTIK